MKDLFLKHPRLWTGGIAGVAIYFFLPQSWSLLTRVLICWNAGVVVFFALIFTWMMNQTAEQICTRYAEEDESGVLILTAVIIAALLSLAAVVEPLATIR